MMWAIVAALLGAATVICAGYLALAAGRTGAEPLLLMFAAVLGGLIAQIAAAIGLVRQQRSAAILQVLLAFAAAAFILHYYPAVSFSDDVARMIARAPALVWAGPVLATGAVALAWRRLL